MPRITLAELDRFIETQDRAAFSPCTCEVCRGLREEYVPAPLPYDRADAAIADAPC